MHMAISYEGRSYQRTLKDIQKASRKRDKLLDAGKISLPSGAGKLAIIVSRVPDHSSKLTPREQHRAFLEEADTLLQARREDHQQIDIKRIAVVDDMKLVFGDPEVTDVALIGHGSLGCLWADGGRYFDWQAAAKAASYLKQGQIEQRMCGNLPSKIGKAGEIKAEELPHKYTVALGTFAVTNLSNVLAAAGREVPEVDPPDDLFQPVYSGEGTVAENIEALNQAYGLQPTIKAA